jgi:hypothetical protein
MRTAWLGTVGLLLVVTAAAWGGGGLRNASWAGFPGISPRSLGMGGLALGTQAGAYQFMQQPAGLGFPLYDGSFSDWMYEKSLNWLNDGASNMDYFGGALSAYDPQSQSGWGAGWGAVTNGVTNHGGGVGYGRRLGQSPFSWGANAIGCFPDYGDDEVYFNGGFAYQPDGKTRVSALLGDLTDCSGDGPYVSIGGTTRIGNQTTVGVDIIDILGQSYYGPFFNLGAQFRCGANSPFTLLAGVNDVGTRHDLSIGVSYEIKNWAVDLGYQNGEYGDTWGLGVSHNFR